MPQGFEMMRRCSLVSRLSQLQLKMPRCAAAWRWRRVQRHSQGYSTRLVEALGKTLDDIPVDPWRHSKGCAETERQRQPSNVGSSDDETQNCGTVLVAAQVGPVPCGFVERGGGGREGDGPEDNFGENVREGAGDAVLF